MGPGPRVRRRALLAVTSCAALTACQAIPFLSPRRSTLSNPLEALNTFFALLSTSHYADAEQLITPAYRARLGPAGVQELIHSVTSARVTDAVDAVAWANSLGAQLPKPPEDRREYLVTLEVSPSPDGRRTWSTGLNRRFIDLLRQDGVWKVDGIGVLPGELITGPPKTLPSQSTLVLPSGPLRLGPTPVDRAIYGARQNAVARGAIPWATDPLEVVHHDGPSFGLDPSAESVLIRKDVDPSTLTPRAFVRVRQRGHSYLVTLIQPIQTGPGGVWAIAAIQDDSSPLPG